MTRITKLAAMVVLGGSPLCAERRLIVSIPDRRMALIVDGQVKKTYGVAVGKPATPSPTGTFKIVVRIPELTWYGHRKVVGPGKSNPLGTRWIGLNEKGYGVHGTRLDVRTIRTQAAPILDFAISGATLAVLEPFQLTVHNEDQGVWRAATSLPLSLALPLPKMCAGASS